MKFFILTLFPLFSLFAQTDDSWKVFSDSTPVRIDITINNATLQWIYNNVQSDSEHIASVRFRNAYIDETLDSIGFRLRGNTSRTSKKKSFKVSFNSFTKGRKFHGVEKLNLNGEHNDPSIIRSKLSFDLFRDMGITASRANHARVYINGVYYGLYVNVEHVDEEFLKKNFADDSGNLWKCLYGADLKYLGTDPAAYKKIMNGNERSYDLKTNETADDYTNIIRLAAMLNNTSAGALADSIDAFVDIARVLQYFAVNTLVGSWDDYRSLMNNYYLYHTPSSGKFTIIPYDYDNTFGVDWFNVTWATANPYQYPKAVDGPRPLWEKIIANDQYRDLYTHFLQFYRENAYALPLWEARLDRLKETITIAAAEDQYRTLDYGFTINDFNNSYTSGTYSKQHVKSGLKAFVNSRYTSLAGQLSMFNTMPTVYGISFAPAHPAATDSIAVTVSAFGAAGVREVWIRFTPNGSGAAQLFPMTYAPVPGTKRVEEYDRWTGTIPPRGSGTFRIAATDSLDRTLTYPRTGSVAVKTSAPSAPSVIVNEFMADNTTIPDPAGQYDDWIELYNPTAQPVVLTNKYLSDKSSSLTKWKFTQPGLIIAPGEYLIVWCDEEPLQPGIHAMIKLSAGGEFIALTDSDGVTVLDSLSFGPQRGNISFGRYPNAASSWGFMNPTPLASNSQILDVRQSDGLPHSFSLNAFPNPFNPSTTIVFTLPGHSSSGEGNSNRAVLEIFNLLGEHITTLVDQAGAPGRYLVSWNAARFSSGMYVARLRYGGWTHATRMMLLK
jgi:hypothetical protein